MPFDPISWALSYGLSRGVSKLTDRPRQLEQRLRDCVLQWSWQLPADLALHADALAPAIQSSDSSSQRPARDSLREELENLTVPSAELWRDCLLEHWRAISSALDPEDAQPFFAADENAVRPHIEKLASLLERECRIDESLFRQTVTIQLADLRETMATLADSPQKSERPTTEFERDLRDWFATLKYEFEHYDGECEEGFEWVIQVPARRGYDRILVRGVDGGSQLTDLDALGKTLERLPVDEAWLVTARRIAPSVRSALSEYREKHENIYCYTVDEIIDQHADFSGYIDWLDADVRQRGIDTTYVALARIFHPVLV